ncbi:protein jagged-1b isoform X1 [Cydia pomonella]|uniref:protein jagged-1b isoform X1 n=1 Tax=Cydia pomonella TaxID=82600 RepID=UPI002ADDBA20|nr:protein jagged-1b isoform X1 [Cydia pomonella]
MRRARAAAAPPPPAPASASATPLLLLLLALLHMTAGAGVFELQILEFSNYRLQLASGACCGGAGGAGGVAGAACAAPCRTRFSLCLKEYQSAAAPGACSFGRAASPVLGTDSFTLAEPLYTLALPFSFRWTRSFTLILQAYDDYNYTTAEGTESGLIVEAWWSGIVEPGAAWHALRHAGAAAGVAYRVRVSCAPNYYNTTCTTFCRARDDKFGHYACDDTGAKRCLPGWRGDNCEQPVCKEGCHPTHGRCDRPGDCDCRPGWRGALCSQCQPYPGCKHGYCNGSSWDCTCDTNWGGILCDQDLNYCGTHEPCQHGGTCENTAPDQYLCTCAEGFSGADCERVDNPCAPQPCAHGACSLRAAPPGFSCACAAGWGGALCDQDVDDCASQPCAHGATCRDRLNGFDCECAPGWTGPTCTEDVDECAMTPEREGAEGAEGSLGPCVNAAACSNTPGGYLCSCLAGWTGRDCESNVDDCTGQCLNGATCIDLVDDFHCACAAGYAGRTCERDVDDCAPRPCRNGGECVDLLDAYRCICPVGFSGVDCEDDRDHCAGSPCANDAPCYTAQSDYYCHCAPGWTGKNCTQYRDRAVLENESCVNGAACEHGQCVRAPPAPPRCVCAPNYAGPTCQERVEECVASGCGVGGACVEVAGALRCVCRAGFSGAHCELEVDECMGNPCRNNATCVDGVADFTCICRDGWTGKTCAIRGEDGTRCVDGSCGNGGTCVREAGVWRCACPTGWAGSTCETSAPAALPPAPACACAHGGTCTAAGAAWACTCAPGWTGAHCEHAVDACAAAPCRNGGRCVGGPGWWTCECAAGWAGPECGARVPPAPPATDCSPACPAPAACVHDPDPERPARCVCPRAARRCLEQIAGLELDDGFSEWGVDEEESGEAGAGGGGGAGGGACGADNGTWWWGCNACWCRAGAPVCTRLWCGLPDCLAPGAQPCRTDEVCVPAAPALCLRPVCAPLGECRRVAGRRVEPPALPAPAACWPGARPAVTAAAAAPTGCARVSLQLARERLARGAHVERACGALRRALAAALATRTDNAPPPPLVLLCDLAVDDDDALDLAIWVGEEESLEGASSAGALAAAVRALSELVARRRLAHHPLLGAALRLRVPHAPPAAAASTGAPGLLTLAAVVPVLLLAAAAGAAFAVRRRRAAAAERSRRCDEEKSNNLQNEENLRRYANPLRESPRAAGGVGPGGAVRAGEPLPRAHSLYKAQNADARNHTPPRDKELTKRALPPDAPPPPAPAPAARHPPPERLTVLV